MEKDYLKHRIPDLKDKMPSVKQALRNEFDFDFSVNENIINSVEDFNKYILEPYKNNNSVFYRGEKCNNKSRRLIPTLFRNDNYIFEDESQPISIVNCNLIIDIYEKMGDFLKIYNETDFAPTDTQAIYYYLFSFAQHYLDLSPFIDFTKDPFIALSFALKDRKEFNEDILIYTVEILDDKNYTDNPLIAERWINDYKVTVSRPKSTEQTIDYIQKELKEKILNGGPSKEEVKLFIENVDIDSNPKAKLIDAPTNDLMKYQKGVFLLLSDFNLFYNTYFTKSIRQDFRIQKNVISKDICKELFDLLKSEKPHYLYKYLTNISLCFREFKSQFNK